METVSTTISTATNVAQYECSNFWLYVSLVLILIILYNSFAGKRSTRLDKFKKSNIDMMAVMDDINKSRDLYKELSRKYHPDRFTDKDDKDRAEGFMKEITKHKNNYAKLLELKNQLKNQ